MKLLAFNIIQQTVTEQTEIWVNQNCNAVTVRNIGDDVLLFNGIPLQPPPGVGLSGESVAFEGNYGEVYTGRIQIQFAGVGINPIAEITQKFYIDNN
jgi:hypothetical protein